MSEEKSEHMNQNGLEPQQYLDIYDDKDEPFLVGKDAVVRNLLYFAAGLVVVLVVLANIVKIPREVNLRFELMGGGEEVIAQFPDRISIQARHKLVGEDIKKDQPIMTVYSEKIISYVEEIKGLESEISFYKETLLKTYQAENELLIKKHDGLKAEIDLLKEKIEKHQSQYLTARKNLNEQIDLQKKAYERNLLLHQDKVISDSDLEASLQSLKALEQQLITASDLLRTRITDYEHQKKSLESELNTLGQQQLVEIMKQDNQLANLLRKLDQIYGRLEVNYGSCRISGRFLDLLSPSDGVLKHINESQLEVAPSQILWRLQTNKEDFYAYSESDSQQIGSLSKDQKVVLKLESFPHYYYGTISAQIQSLSSSPDAFGKYPLVIEVLDAKDLEKHLTKGMEGTATVIVEEKPLIQYLFKRVLKAVTIE